MDIFARTERNNRRILEQTRPWILVGELCCRFATCLSPYKCCVARVLPGCGSLDRSGELPFSRSDFLMDNFWSGAGGEAGRELPSDRGIAVQCCSGSRTLWGFQRKLDADHANNRAARELAGGMARANRGADQRCASGARAKPRFSAALGCEDPEGRTGRYFRCW